MSNRRRTKIIATIGPASSDSKTLTRLIEAGANAFRLNFSHGTVDEHAETISLIQSIRRELRAPIGILQDLGGQKIRLGDLSETSLALVPGDKITFDSTLEISDGRRLPVNHEGFADDVREGHELFLADGSIVVKILRVEPPAVECEVLIGGTLTSRKGINYPDGTFNVPAVTQKDIEHFRLGVSLGIDFVSPSFVRSAEDLLPLKEIANEVDKPIPFIVKIEKHEAVERLNEIVNASDGVIVARGDLGVEVLLEKVPGIQKHIIHEANFRAKPVIIATQMLSSMTQNLRPTRAEVADIANAILDGADMLMLSEETAVGEHPVEALETMARIAIETERNYHFLRRFKKEEIPPENAVAMAVSGSAASLSQTLSAPIILCPTSSGFTAKVISCYRPEAMIFALTHREDTFNRLGSFWGVIPVKITQIEDFEELIEMSLETAARDGLIGKGEHYIVTAGFPFNSGSSTNLIKAGRM
ncbi:MAG TPA: pyruvate kinase [candidate division Zixibacteria bacterium]|nr:pyruvate kinase [candidate division Zixibacteria bacterium]